MRHGDWYHKRFAGEVSGVARAEGEKLLGEVVDRCMRYGLDQYAREKVLSDGSVARAMFVAGQPILTITPPPPPVDDAPEPKTREFETEMEVKVYIMSAGGLRIFDYTTGDMRTLTGIHSSYEVDAVSEDGKYVFLVSPGVVLRINTEDLTFIFHTAYHATALTDEAGIARPEILRMSPDEKRLLVSFSVVYRASDGIALDGLGGFLVVDPETLLPIRPPIRTSYRTHAHCWAHDSKRFYVATSFPSGESVPPTNPRAATATTDYISAFDADGNFLDARLLRTWPVAPNEGWARTITGMAATAKRVYVVSFEPYIAGGVAPGFTLHALNAEASGMPEVASLYFPTSSLLDAPSVVQVSRDGKHVQIHMLPNRFIRVSTRNSSGGDALSVVEDVTLPGVDTSGAYPVVAANIFYSTMLRQGPEDAEMDSWYFISKDGTSSVIHGYESFADAPEGKVYEVDLTALNVNRRFVIAATDEIVTEVL
jgi:hypothetical protein